MYIFVAISTSLIRSHALGSRHAVPEALKPMSILDRTWLLALCAALHGFARDSVRLRPQTRRGVLHMTSGDNHIDLGAPLEVPGSGTDDERTLVVGQALEAYDDGRAPAAGRAPEADDDAAALCAPAAGQASEDEHIILGEVLSVPRPPRLRFVQRSVELMSHARSAREKGRSREQAAAFRARNAALTTALGVVARAAPNVSRLIRSGGANHTSRRKNPTAEDMELLCHAVHIPLKRKVTMGVNHHRLVCTAASYVLARQTAAMKSVFAAAARSLADPMQGRKRRVHLTAHHCWDEVDAKVRSLRHKKARTGRMAERQHVLIQKGVLSTTLMDLPAAKTHTYSEYVVSKPQVVQSTSALSLLPGLLRGLPYGFDIFNHGELQQRLAQVSSMTLTLLGDKASGNVLAMKLIAREWYDKVARTFQGRCLILFETCGIHQHHRAKLQLRPLRHHTGRHYSLVALHRQGHIKDNIIKEVEAQVMARLQRRVRAPDPGERCTLRSVCEILYKLDSDPPRQGQGAQRSQDLRELCRMVSSDLRSSSWYHDCFDPVTQRPCCKSASEAKERAVAAVVTALFGSADVVPGESTWTHTLTAFKKTLLRRLTHGVGVSSFKLERDPGERTITVDGEAMQDFHSIVQSTRIKKVRDYYASASTFTELTILFAILDIFDRRLLFPLLGDLLPGGTEEKPSKICKVLSRSSSLVGACGQDFLGLMRQWEPGAHDKSCPWLLLEVLSADFDDQSLMKFARGQILRMNSSMGRRCEDRLSSWPYLLRRLYDDEYSQQERVDVARSLLAASERSLDCYSWGLRLRYQTVDALLSQEARSQLEADLENLPYGTDAVERMNSEFTHLHPHRAPARQFTHAAREALLQQVAIIHRSRGGSNPLRADVARPAARVERHSLNPLLPVGLGVGEVGLEAGRDLPSMQRPPSGSNTSIASEPAAASGPCSASAPRSESSFGCPLEIDRPVSSQLAVVLAAGGAALVDEGAVKKGLSAFMLAQNDYMAGVKRSAGRKLTLEETSRARARFKELYAAADKTAFKEVFAEWRHRPRVQGRVACQQKPYLGVWGGGCVASPIAPRELHDWVRKEGWPSDATVFEQAAATVEEPMNLDLSSAALMHIWSIGREPRNIEKASMPDREKHEQIHIGLCNLLEATDKAIVESGNFMVMVQGQPLSIDVCRRHIALVTGVTWNPKCFEVTVLKWRDGDLTASMPEMHLPSLVSINVRQNKVSDAFEMMDTITSDTFAATLARTLEPPIIVFVVEHDVDTSIDHTLMWSKLKSVQSIGVLWDGENKTPLLQKDLAERRRDLKRARQRLQTSDPLAEKVAPAVRPSRGGGRARGDRLGSRRAGRGDAAGGAPCGGRGGAAPPLADGLVQASDDPDAFDDEMVDGLDAELLPGDRFDMADMDDDQSCGDDSDMFEDEPVAQEGLVPPSGFASASGDGQALVFDHETPPEEAVIDAVAGALAVVPCMEGGASGSGAGFLASDNPVEAPAPPPEVPPWDRLSTPGKYGYLFLDGRSVLRIQRGRPRGSVTISCYRHSACHVLLSERQCPSDEDIRRWAFETPASPPHAPAAVRKAQAAEHMAIAKSRWKNRDGARVR